MGADEFLGNPFGEVDFNFIAGALKFFIFKLIVNELLEYLEALN